MFFKDRPEPKLQSVLIERWIEVMQRYTRFSHKLAHKVENVPNPVQSYDIWSVA